MEEHQSNYERPALRFSASIRSLKYYRDNYDTISNDKYEGASNENGKIVYRYYRNDPEIKNRKISQQRLLRIDDLFLDIEDYFYEKQDFSKIINISKEEFSNLPDNMLIEEENMYVETIRKSCVNYETNMTYYFKILTKYKRNEEKPRCEFEFLSSFF